MKRILLIITLLCIVIVSNSYNFPSKFDGKRVSAYDSKTLEVMYDSKQRPQGTTYIKNNEQIVSDRIKFIGVIPLKDLDR